MDFESILADSSKLLAEQTAKVVGNNEVYFRELMQIALLDKHRLSPRAANVAEFCCSKYPELVQSFIPQIIDSLTWIQNDGVKRIFLKILTRNSCPSDEQLMTRLLNLCFNYLVSPNEKPAVKHYSMMILFDISNIVPELKNELIIVIEDQYHKNTQAFMAMGKRMLKKLHKEIKS